MNLEGVLSVVTPGLVVRGLWHHLRTAAREASTASPPRRGLSWLAHVWKRVRPTSPAPPARVPLAALTAFTRLSPRAVELKLGEQRLIIDALADDLIELREVGAPPSWSTLPTPWPGAELALEEHADRVVLSTPALRLTVTRSPLRLRLEAPLPAKRREGQGEGPPRSTVLLEDVELYTHGLRASVPPSTTFHGLGEKARALDLAGGRYELWNTDPALYGRGDDPLYLSVPFLLARGAGPTTGVFFDNTFRSTVDLTGTRLEWLAHDGPLRLHLTAGTPAQVLERYTALTGRPRLPPLWALGFHQSRYSYYPQARVLELAKAFRERRIPCDVLHLDIHYMDGYRCFTWHPKRFPEPRAMLQQLHESGFKALSMIDPGIKVDPGYRVYDEGLSKNAFLTWPDGEPFRGPVWPGDCHFPDYTSPATRAWWGEQYRGLLDDGVDAFWNDMNEVALLSVPVGAQVPESLRHDADGRGAAHAEVHNVYGLSMARASVEGLERLRPTQRPVLLTRSGWAGVQRYAMHWTGDNGSTFDDLRLSLQMVLNLGLSGIAFTGPDTGGFEGSPTPELFARWMQLSAFLPFFRVHSIIGSPDQEPWAFGEEVERVARSALERRYRLLPALYTAAWQASRFGTPVARPMFFSFPDDPRFAATDDQFMFGDALLVAPVLEPGAVRRKVLLPEGTWFDLATGARHEGGGQLEVEAPLDVCPVFARGGTVVPSWELQQFVGEKPIDTLELTAFVAPGEHESVLYEDDGLSVNGPHRLSRFTLSPRGLTRSIVEGTWEPPARQVRLRVVGLERAPIEFDAPGAFSVEFG